MTDVPAEIGLTPAWDEALRDIPEQGLERDRTASPEERAALARLLDIISVDALRASYRVRPAGHGRYSLKGKLQASIVQACVVSLQPLNRTVEHDLAAVFWPADEMHLSTGGAVDLDEEPDPEPIENGRLPLARVIFETFASAIDPFPRADDAVMDWTPDEGDSKPASPFAALAKLKK